MQILGPDGRPARSSNPFIGWDRVLRESLKILRDNAAMQRKLITLYGPDNRPVNLPSQVEGTGVTVRIRRPLRLR